MESLYTASVSFVIKCILTLLPDVNLLILKHQLRGVSNSVMISKRLEIYEALSRVRSTTPNARVPRFTAEAEVDLQAPLSALGLTDMFAEGKADFRHLSE